MRSTCSSTPAPHGSDRRISGNPDSLAVERGIAAGPSSLTMPESLGPSAGSSRATSILGDGTPSPKKMRPRTAYLRRHRTRPGPGERVRGIDGPASLSVRMPLWIPTGSSTCSGRPATGSPSRRSISRRPGAMRRIPSSRPRSKPHLGASSSGSSSMVVGRPSKPIRGRTMTSSPGSIARRRNNDSRWRPVCSSRAAPSNGCTTRGSSWTAVRCSCPA